MASRDPSGLLWDEGLRRYRSPDGRFVSRAAVRAALDAAVERAQAGIEATARRLVDGAIDLGAFRAEMARGIRAAHAAAAAAAGGGWHNAGPAAWGTAGGRVARQLRYLEGMVADVGSGRQRLDGGLVARAAMYGRSARATFESVARRGDLAAGFDEERRRVNSSDACAPCIDYAAWGWQPAGTLPLPTEACSCRSNCVCSIERRRSSSVPPPAAPEGWPPSGAEVRFDDEQSEREAVAWIRRATGRADAGPADLAELAGATPGARVSVSTTYSGVRLLAEGPGHVANRTLNWSGVPGERPYVVNESFYVEPGRQGRGLGRESFGRQVAAGRRLGFDHVRTVASGSASPGDDIGYRVWPRFGYDAPLPEKSRARVADELAGGPEADAMRLSDLMRTERGRAWWDEHGGMTAMEFDLTPGSLSNRAWDDYLARRGGPGG
jgi:hypothetical protein